MSSTKRDTKSKFFKICTILYIHVLVFTYWNPHFANPVEVHAAEASTYYCTTTRDNVNFVHNGKYIFVSLCGPQAILRFANLFSSSGSSESTESCTDGIRSEVLLVLVGTVGEIFVLRLPVDEHFI